MNERRSLHPLYIAYGFLSVIKGLLPLIIIMLLRGVNWDKVLQWYWIAGAAGLFALMLVLSYLQWKRFGFWLENDRIVIRSGLLFREEKTIYYSRIHSVNVEQPLIQRLLRTAQLKIETPGGGQKSDGILHVLSVAEANRIKEQLRAHAEGTAATTATASAGARRELADPNGDAAETREEALLLDDALLSDEAGEKTSATTSSEGQVRQLQTPAGSNGALRQAEDSVRLDTGQLFKAAATSLNFGLAIAFIGGLYSFADDFLELLLPDGFFEHLIEDTQSLMSSVLFIVGIAVFVILFAWVLSIGLFILKFSGFTMGRAGQQVSISYGLLEKKSYVFDPKNVQAVIINESILRQWIGFAEVRLQIVSSDKQEQLMLHPFVAFRDIDSLLARFVPGMRVFDPKELSAAPAKALLYYLRVPYIIAVMISAACIGFFGVAGIWSVFLFPLVYAWRKSCHRAAGGLLKEGQLTLRHRLLHRTTYLVRRPRIVALKAKSTAAQRRKGLSSVAVHALGSGTAFGVTCLDRNQVEEVWQWYSRHPAAKEEKRNS
ncbi:hypothetical protein B1748_01745 [Paenibacillus sp. MY03]|jgi:putative membrane protein|uniref:PH domain-containing protein n=1 Tax=Paenibacillus sp. MY03 TaxID=302980 RepID=UPI000B3D1CF5|nr:PH domain-containing protein [Paenibacillus sp. MY03]OUS78347.1 hypothetical protein B1748_01745 [Paenibacillus sp. MY03]